MRRRKESQLFGLEDFDKIPEHLKVQEELEKKKAEIIKHISKNVDEIEQFFTDGESQLELINSDSDEAEIVENRLQYLPYYAYTEELGWAVDKEEGWIYECLTEYLIRIPYNEKVVDLLWSSDGMQEQYEETKLKTKGGKK